MRTPFLVAGLFFISLIVLLKATTFFVEEARYPAIYKQIKDIRHPTLQDYHLLQDYLTNRTNEELSSLKDTQEKMHAVKIIGNTPDEIPQSGIIPVNSTMEEKENCVIIYSSFNMHYPDGLRRLVKLVKNSDFKGHIIYHIGGWPDLEEGSLRLAHVPQTWKPCCFKEAQKMGYKRILWLDCSIIPLVSLNTIFKMIEDKGYFTVANYHSVGAYCNEEAAAFFGFTLEETNHLLSCQSCFIGVDLTCENGRQIVDMFYRAAQDKYAFYTPRLDQTVLSLILHKLHLSEFTHITKAIHHISYARPDTLFVIDRPFVQY